MTASAPLRPTRRRSLDRRLRRAALAFDTDILEVLHRRDPEDLEVLAALAEACTRLRRYRRGLQLDHQLVERAPRDPTVRYNLACSLCLTGDIDAAVAALEQAVELGYRDFDHVDRDPDLRRLRADARYASLRRRLSARARRLDEGP